MDVFVARQPIFDRRGRLNAYELLFRSDGIHNTFDGACAASASAVLIANSLFSIGMEKILCGMRAFINFDRALLLSGLHSLLPPKILVVEILESVEPDAEIVSACRDLCQQGYTIALDDFVFHPQFEQLTPLAKVMKIDLLATPHSEQERLLRKYQPLGVAMLAEKVETPEDFEWARNAGYDLFQGFFFARPNVVKGQQIPAAKITCMRLLAETQKSELDFERLKSVISQDVSLSYNLLLYVNSPLFSHRRVHSIDHALALLGEENIRHWAVLATLPILAKDKPGELITLSLVRARFCERLAQLAGIAQPGLAFLMGLFSLLDALTGLSLEDALVRVHVASAIQGALIGPAAEHDPYRDVYQLACRYEQGDWGAVGTLGKNLGIQAYDIAASYAESTLWANQALHATTRKADSRRHVRAAASGRLRILWEEHAGRERVIQVQLVNASAMGLQFCTEVKIPAFAQISCNDPRSGISGRGRVRYCSCIKGRYFIGVEFQGGTGWRGQSALEPAGNAAPVRKFA